MAGRKEKFNLPSQKRALRLPVWLWNRLDEIAEDQGKIAQDVIYDQIAGVEYRPNGNFNGLINEMQEVIRKYKIKE